MAYRNANCITYLLTVWSIQNAVQICVHVYSKYNAHARMFMMQIILVCVLNNIIVVYNFLNCSIKFYINIIMMQIQCI